MMTKRERFMNFLQNKPVDRVPVAFFHHFCPTSEWGTGVVNQDAFERNIIGHKYAREKFDPEVIKVMHDTLMIMPVDVSHVKCAADLRNVEAPSLSSDFTKKTLELTKRTLEFYKDSDAPTYATGFSPSMVLRKSLCPEAFQDTVLHKYMEEDPDAVAAGMCIRDSYGPWLCGFSARVRSGRAAAFLCQEGGKPVSTASAVSYTHLDVYKRQGKLLSK